MPSARDDDVRRVRRWLRLSGALTLLAGLGCLGFLTASGSFRSPTRLLVLMACIGLIVYGIAALSTVVGPGSTQR
jgi:hypothetical protein